jgi:HEAT repeat protein
VDAPPGQLKNDADVTEVLAELHAPEAERRHNAAEHLAHTDPNPARRAEVASALEGRLLDSNESARDMAAKALVVWATPENVPALINALEHESGTVRGAALEALGKLKDRRAAEPVAGRLPFDRQQAASALQAMGPTAENAVADRLFHSDSAVQKEAAHILKGYGTKHSVLLAHAVVALQAADGTRRRGAAAWLSHEKPNSEPSPEVAHTLESLLADHEGATRVAALKALSVWATRESVPALIRVLDHDDAATRRAALEVLAKLKDARAAEAIAQRLYGDRQQASSALQALGPSAEKDVVKYVGDKDVAVRVEACRILRVIGTKESVAALEGAARDKNRNVATAARNALKDIAARP